MKPRHPCPLRRPLGSVKFGVLLSLLLISFSRHVLAADTGLSQSGGIEDSRDPKVYLKRLLIDQRRIWTAPWRARPKDAEWLVPLAGITAGLIMTDRTSEFEISRGNHMRASDRISNYGLAAYGGTVAGLYALGRHWGDDRLQETTLLSGEAGLSALAAGTVLEYLFERNQPNQGDGKGHFFRPVSSSFYSSHSTVAWSFAAVIASEYPGWLSQGLAYGGASVISLARVSGQKHWTSDAFAGAAIGYMIGKNVYRARHDKAIDDQSYGTFVNSHPVWSYRNAGSTYVPLDSWVYPVLERMMAAGLVRYGYLGMRPYTRTAVAEMVAEAKYRIEDDNSTPSELKDDLAQLEQEFHDELNPENSENRSIRIESLYTRVMGITGQPLADGYHFGQTIINDFGRPYQSGFNDVTGFAARAETGRFAFYARGEYQHAPGAPAYPLSARDAIAQADANPVEPALPFSPVNQFRLLDTYASVTLLGHNIAIGKQSLWWGPDDGGAMIFSDNAEPIYMAQINRTVPLRLPLLSKLIGPVRYDFFFGKLSGHQFPPNPYMHGEKISFKPTENLEFGFSRTAVFAGQGLTPLTFGTFWSSLTSTTSSTSAGANLRNSPGVRHGQFDFSYRIPGLRDWLTIYSDSLVHDDISPIDAPRRAAIEPGFYLSHFPMLPKLDLRVEAANTDPRITSSNGGKFFYWESFYHDAYLNKSSLLGSWIGREGKGVQAWSTYWISPLSTLQISYRNQKVAKDFISEGVSFNSFAAKATIRVLPDVEMSGVVQYDRWSAPVLNPGIETNVSTSLQFTFWPKQWKIAAKRE